MKKLYILAMFVVTTVATTQVKKPTAVLKQTKPTTGVKPAQTNAPKQTSFPSVTIGDQVWMSKNLDVSTFSNGDPIPQAQTSPAWRKAAQEKKPAWCYYQVPNEVVKYFGNPAQSKKYGKLYNFYAINDPRGLAPKEWQIPNEKDWLKLIQYVEDNVQHNEFNKSQNVANALKSKLGWYDDFENSSYNTRSSLNQGKDIFGLNLLAAGNRGSEMNAFFENIGDNSKIIVYEPIFKDDRNNDVVEVFSITHIDHSFIGLSPGDGFSVRCFKVKEYEPTAQDYYNNGTAKFNVNDYNGAIEEYTKAINLSPDSYLCYYQRGNMKGWLKNWNEARIDHEKAWKLVQAQNLYNDASVKDLLYQLGGNFFSSDKEKACYYFNEAVKYGNEKAKEYVKKCNEEKINDLIKSGYAKQTNKDYEGATIDFTKILDLDRNSYLAFIYKGNVQGEQNKWHDAIVDYEASWNIIKTNNLYQESSVKDLLLNLGFAYLKINNKESGCFYLNEAIKYGSEAAKQYIDKCDQERSDALLKSGILKYESKDFEGAISDFTASNVLSRNGNKGPIIFRRAESKFSLQRWEDAIKDYQRVWNIFKIGNYKDEEKSLVLFSLGKSYIQLNNLENACYFLNEAVKLKNTGAQELIDKFCNKGENILQSEPILEQE